MWTDSQVLAVATAIPVIVLAVLVQILSALLERSGPIRLRHWAEEAGGRILTLYELPLRFEVFRYLLGWMAKMAPVALVIAFWPLFQAWTPQRPILWAMVAAALIVASTELLSRSLVGRDPERALRYFTWFYRLSLALVTPLLKILSPLFPASIVERQDDEDEVTEDEIEAFLSVGTQEGILEPGEDDLIQRVIDFGDSLVKSVVTPRIDMVCAPLETDLEEMAELFLSSKHSRIPIFRESVDQIVGILHIRDLLRGLRQDEGVAMGELVLDPYFVPETKPLNELLEEFQAQRQQVAIVVDEYGGTAGMVTVEDLLEEIVGEIEDEHDEAAPQSEALEDGRWRVDGRLPLETLEDIFDVEVEDEPYETVGGLIFGRLGFVPGPGQELRVYGLTMRVEKVEARRIKTVLVWPAEEEVENERG
jgi:CBS domain containing-hemolysin-like protein